MPHKQKEMIAIWNSDNSTKFEFAYGVGVNFTWQECDIHYIIDNPNIQVRVKKQQPKKEKRWIGYCANTNQTFPHPQKSKELACDYAASHYKYHENEWQFIEIEVEV